MNSQEIKKILSAHKIWLETKPPWTESKTNLRNADLRNADLRGADLTGIYFCGADLTGADLTGADLTDAVLSNANLTVADLSNANLSNTYFSCSDLTGTIFTLEFKKVIWFRNATFSEDAIPWVILNPRYSDCADTLTFV